MGVYRLLAVGAATSLLGACTLDFDSLYQGTSTGTGGAGGGAESCSVPADCPTAESTCRWNTCHNGSCGLSFTAPGVPCTEAGGQVCDGQGSCVDCLSSAHCGPGQSCNEAQQCVPDACADSIKNGSETDVDCGGGSCPPCGNGQQCLSATDCLSLFCDSAGGTGPGSCQPCTTNGDCSAVAGTYCSGSVCVDQKPSGDPCSSPGECLSGFCSDDVCCAQACDGACEHCDQGGTEGMCIPYPEGSDPEGECAPDTCGNGGLCRCLDGLTNGAETDVDCGGGSCPACAAGAGCNTGADCASGACTAGICSAGCGDGLVNVAAEQCDGDGAGNGGETATCDDDCTFQSCGDGHPNAAAGEACDDAGESFACDADCTPAICGDGTLNVTAGEGCDDGNGSDNDDCPDVTGSCQPANCFDGLLHNQASGNETDVDCGGSCPPCSNGSMCLNNGDCLSGSCPADDLVCCDTACSTQCEACVASKTGGTDGVCSAVLGGSDPDAECGDTGGPCGPNGGGCNGSATDPHCNGYTCSCAEQYPVDGSAILTNCAETPAQCTLRVNTLNSGSSCSVICTAGGGECVAYYNDNPPNSCGIGAASTCTATNYTSAICICSRGCGGGAACEPPFACSGGDCT